MARIAVLEEVESIRNQEYIDDLHSVPDYLGIPEAKRSREFIKYIPKSQEVHDAFDSVNILRFFQPTHLQGLSCTQVVSCVIDHPIR